MISEETALPKAFFPFVGYFLRSYKLVVFMVVACGVLAGLWGPINNFLIKEVIDALPQVASQGIAILFLPASLIIVNFIVLDNITWRLADYLNYRYQGEIKNKIIKTTYGYVLNASHQFFQDNLADRIASQVIRLADNIELILQRIALDLIRGTSLLLATFVVSYTVNPIFAYVLMIWFLLFSTLSISMSVQLVNLADSHAETESLLSGQVVDSIANHSNIRFFSRRPFELLRLDSYLSKVLKAYRKKEGFALCLYSLQGAMIAAMMGFSVYFLVYFYAQGSVSAGDFALILGLAMFLGHMMWWTMSRVDDFNQAFGKYKQSLTALMLPLEILDDSNATKLTCSRAEIVFKDVTFAYKEGEPLFQHKSITIQPGEKVGLVGYSGGGKSTFINLILRMYDVNEGSNAIDDQDIRKVTLDSLRNNIAIIPQDPSLFHRSLLDNINYGNVDASKDEVIAAAKQAHAHEFIYQLPHGYDSLVGERGVKLSGGQRQRIAIARAILKNAPILIMDEATSQLDSVTESLIQESLWNLMTDKTTIVIAHRLSTLLHMDRILVFDKGSIVEDGKHSDLLEQGGIYTQLWNAQVGGFLGDNWSG